MLESSLLNRVHLPGRYLGNEINAVRKDWDEAEIRFALAFPDLFEVGMSHVGMGILYAILNRRSDTLAERVFAPAPDLARILEEENRPLTSLESDTPLFRFDVVGFSLQTELDFTNVLHMLDLGGIPLYADRRSEGDPLVLGGGPCTCNPEPVAPFFDALLVGEGEESVERIVDVLLDWKQGRGSREELLRALAAVPGVYVPRFFKAHYDEQGRFVEMEPLIPGYETVKRAVVADLDAVPFPEAPILPFVKVVHDRLCVEIARGCSRGCRFCQAGMIYRPVRERSPERVRALVRAGLAATGYEDVSLLALSAGDYSCLDDLLHALMEELWPQRVSVSLPSLRAGTVSEPLMKQIRRVRKTGFTFAPEAATQRLRDVINKNITEDDLSGVADYAFGLGWSVLKTYFMIGLPTETMEDVEAIPELALRLLGKGRKGRNRTINVSYALFVPKAQTPFQWAPQDPLDRALEKMEFLRNALHRKGLQPKWNNPRMGVIEGCLARGGREAARWIFEAYRLGCRLDAWTEHFKFARWEEALRNSGAPDWSVLQGPRDPGRPLPWDHIRMGVDRAYLEEEYDRALRGVVREDCRNECHACGVCNETLRHRIAQPAAASGATPPQEVEVSSSSESHRYRLTFCKTGPARYLGHLDMANAFARAARRARLPLCYSEGFHPHPRIVFHEAIPLGVESFDERVDLLLSRPLSPDSILEALNARLPEGLRVQSVRRVSTRPKPARGAEYRIADPAGVLDRSRIESFRRAGSFPVVLHRKKRKSALDLKRFVELEQDTPEGVRMAIVHPEGLRLKPFEVLQQIFGLSDSHRDELFTTKLRAL